MIHFSERIAIVNLYEMWLRQHREVVDDPLSFFAFMQMCNLINEEELKKVCSEYFRRGGNNERI